MLKVLLFIFSAFAGMAAIAAPGITVVVGEGAPALERSAASELASQLGKLLETEAKVQTAVPMDGSPAVLIGSPKTNAAIAALGSAFWPALSEQGQVLKSAKTGDRTVLVAGGGSPLATMWAAHELTYRLGIRPLLQGDAFPIEKPALRLDGFDVVLEPLLRTRAWSAFTGLPMGAESWSLDDHARLLAQLAKLKFTHIVLPAKIPEFAPIPVTGDIGGRIAFKGMKVFESPSLPAGADAAARAKAAAEFLEAVKARAAAVGIKAVTEAPAGTRVLSLGAPGTSVLPQFSLRSLAAQFQEVCAGKAEGFVANAVVPGDLNAAAHFASRASFDAKLTAERALEDLVAPICGEGVAERLWKGFDFVEQAAKLVAANDPALAVPGPQMFLRHAASAEAPPEWWAKAKDLYLQAMNEMYRGNTRARGGARPFILYHAKRMEFAMHFFTALEGARKAGGAKASARAEAFEAAIEGIYSALNAFADVARDSSDRGVIALLNMHGYLPLLKASDGAGK